MMDRVKLLKASLAEQAIWLDENYPDHIIDAHNENNIGTLFPDLDRKLADAKSFQYGPDLGEWIYGIQEGIPPLRIEEIDNGAPLTDEETEVLKRLIIHEELNEEGGNACTYLEVVVGDDRMISVYQGPIDGPGYRPEFVGIFENINVAKVNLKSLGYFVDDISLEIIPRVVTVTEKWADNIKEFWRKTE
ncbi:hypothetical protein OAD55_03790 [Planktomarina temperata]|nr:hypothetical protein [Planktomarina temperata]